MNKIKIGWSEVSIVPEGRRADLVGQFYERISGEVETPIAVTALAMECGDDHVVFVGCDLVATSRKLLDVVREYLPNDCGFDKNKLIINAIHTHTSLGYFGRSDSFSNHLQNLNVYKPEHVNYVPKVHDDSADIIRGEEARDFIVERIAKAACDAWAKRAEGAYACSFGRAAVGMCRRACYDDGSAKMWGNTSHPNFTELESGNDSGIELMFTYDADKKLTGVIANVACPAQVLEHQNFISSDYMGKVREKIQSKYGKEISFLGLISPAGDMCPRDLIRWVEPHVPILDPNIERLNVLPRKADPSMFEIEGTVKIGKRISREVMDAIEDVTELIGDTKFVHKSFEMDLPYRRVTMGEYNAAKESFDRYIAGKKVVNYADKANTLFQCGIMARYHQQQTRDLVNIEVHIMRLGNIAIATNPFELFVEFGQQIRARSKAEQTFLSQLTCGSYGYLPTEHAENGGHYSAFVGSGTVGHQGGEMYVRKVLTVIDELFSE